MLKPTFKIPKSDRLYIGETHISNGHWLIRRDKLPLPTVPKALKDLGQLMLGKYDGGLRDNSKLPDMSGFEPKTMEGYSKLKPHPKRVIFHNETWIKGYVFETEAGFEVGISADYVELMKLGECFARDKSTAIVIDHAGFIGCIMPVRT